jgi:hypothetical protein
MKRIWYALALVKTVSAHGWAAYFNFETSGNVTGWDPWHGKETAPDAPVRHYDNNGPITGVSNAMLLCRGDNAPISASASVKAGESVTVFWTGSDGGEWPGGQYPGSLSPLFFTFAAD